MVYLFHRLRQQLIKKLKTLRGFGVSRRQSLNILYLYSCRTFGMNYTGAGFVLLSSDLKSVLLVHDTRSNKWGFPKGHRESYDINDLQTATRELFEETGICENQYTVQTETFKIKKGSGSYIFRYAVLHEDERNVLLRPGPSYEIKGVAWVPINELVDDTHTLDGNIYLRTWLEDMKRDVKKRTTILYNLLCECLLPSNKPMCTSYVVTCP